MLPTELVDHVFSFLRGDISALKSCSASHPILSRLAERYLYADIVVSQFMLDASELYERLSKNPRILDYICTLEIQAITTFSLDALGPRLILSMIPRMANLMSLKLCQTQGYFTTRFLSKLFENYLQQSPVEQVHLTRFYGFPLSILNNLKNIKKLTLSDCSAMLEPPPQNPQPLQTVETLIIYGYFDTQLIAQITGQVPNLKSLQVSDAVGSSQCNGVSELLSASSNSLTELDLFFNNHCQMSVYNWGFNGRGDWIHSNLDRDIPFTLSALKRLKRLSIRSLVRSHGPPTVVVSSAFPGIMDFIRTAPTIQDLVLRLHWVDSHPRSLGYLDWSFLESKFSAIRPRIHLFISGDTKGHSISPESILEILTANEALMDLVKRKIVTLEVGHNEPSGG